MGLHGSSTTPLVLQDAKVPAENLLGEIGKGHKIAFNVLNYGRFKLAGMCTGGARGTIGEAARYALGRKQFGNLRVYKGTEHPHTAQQPEALDVAAMNRKNARSA